MTYLKIKDITAYYEIHGKGTPLVLITGLGGTCDTFRTILNVLTRYYKVIVFDNRGAGRTTVAKGCYSIKQMADDTYEFIQKLNLSKPDILGYSMGGYIVQELALAHPESVNRLILSNTMGANNYRNNHLIQTLSLMYKQNVDIKIINRIFAHLLYSNEFINDKDNFDMLMEFIDNYPYAITKDGFLGQASACISHYALDRLRNIKNKILVVSGGKDFMIPLDESEKMFKQFTNSRQVIMSSSAHTPMLEDKKEYIDVILNFLNN
ncbi:MAG TPA: alpha/beta hydrolase [Victivallales bacterium]|nr:alpha/beta hydrolase [Victivallales bacterium]